MGSLLLASGLIAGSASAQQLTTPTSPSPYGVYLVTIGEGSALKAEGLVMPGQPVADVSPVTPAVPSTSAPASCDCAPSKECREPCRSDSRFYGSADYLLWWLKKGGVPALVTQGNPADTPTGALGQPGTTLLFGDSGFGSNPFSGGRFTVGYWLGCKNDWGVETSWLFLQQRHTSFGATSTGDVGTGTLAIPFFNADGGFEDANVVGLEGTQAGAINIRLTQRLWGAEVNARTPRLGNDCFHVCGLAGFRFLDLQESLDLETFASALPASAGISTALAESFATRNRFYGGQIGGEASYVRDRLRITALAKVAFGGNDEAVNINGTTINVDPINGTVVSPGGLFSGPNNIGNHHQGHFAVVPEAGINLGYQLRENVAVNVGYTFLYVSDVVRPGSQIDRQVNFQTNDHPRVLFHQSDFWAQGINVGLQFRY
jgi:hypothetical protein